MPNIFFTGCTHFHHANIIKLANRPFETVEEMDQTLIERWNAKVGKDDLVCHLGDVGWFKSAQHAGETMSQLNGRIRVIKGNHDDYVYADYPYYELEFTNGSKMVLFHYPIEDWNGRWKGSIHLHCHTHAPQFRNPRLPYVESSALVMEDRVPGQLGSRYPSAIKCNRFNVGVDATGFAPVSLDEIIEESRKDD